VPGQSLPKAGSCPSQPAPHGADRAAEPASGLVVGQPFQVTEDDWRSERARQPGQFLVEHVPKLVLAVVFGRSIRDDLGPIQPRHLVEMPTGRAGSRPDRDPMGNSVQPVAHEVAVADRTRAPNQDEESGLEGILDVLIVTENSSANTQDHRPVPRHQGGERHLVALGDEPLEQLALTQPSNGSAVENAVQLFQDGTGVMAHDDSALTRFTVISTLYLRGQGDSNLTFFTISRERKDLVKSNGRAVGGLLLS